MLFQPRILSDFSYLSCSRKMSWEQGWLKKCQVMNFFVMYRLKRAAAGFKLKSKSIMETLVEGVKYVHSLK